MSSNPYGTPASTDFNQASYGGVSNGSLSEAIAPLAESAGWMRLIGWTSIVFGALYCLTIVGIIIAWLPIWMGFCLKNAAEQISAGSAQNDSRLIYDGNKQLKTFFTIVGVLTIINIAIMAIYLVFIVIAIIGLGASAASGNF